MTKSGQQWRTSPKGRQCLPLHALLIKQGLTVHCERKFEWLFHPRSSEYSAVERDIALGLRDHCARTREMHPRKAHCDPVMLLDDSLVRGRRRTLELDFFLPDLNIGIEFDERQHFTAEREVTFNYYGSFDFHFDLDRWRLMCSARIRDPDPPCRDWERAFRDAVRDVRTAKAGVKLLRVSYKDNDGLGSLVDSILTSV